MRNIKLTIAYGGSKYAGWQTQASPTSQVPRPKSQFLRLKLKTVQEEIEKALQKIFQKKIPLVGSGRTDAGVHAQAQVANFKIDSSLGLTKLKAALNGILPKDIAITKVEEVDSDFHARFSAKSKTYRYVIILSREKIAFLHAYGLQVRMPLNVNIMKKESKSLLGRHDFSSFQGSDRGRRRAITTIYEIAIKKCKGCDPFPFLKNLDLVVIDIYAKGFLRSMVRNIVGTLIEIGKDKISEGELKKILKKKDRRSAGPCAPAKGLYLLKVNY